jgi:hypothetical protein
MPGRSVPHQPLLIRTSNIACCSTIAVQVVFSMFMGLSGVQSSLINPVWGPLIQCQRSGKMSKSHSHFKIALSALAVDVFCCLACSLTISWRSTSCSSCD